MGRLPCQSRDESSVQGLWEDVRSLSLRAIINNCTHFDGRFLKSCLRKGKMKREKRRGRKMAKRTQKRVSLLSGLGGGAALQVLIMGEIQLRAGLWQKCGQLGPSLVGSSMC